ncbi:glycosyltransferase family 2 protein [Pelagibius sp. Alg239-R121]|uniref:glycosyltransferase family 2 protein n=1 Tax=Pelagibius sp. Alg239-R121 TaxID=2993448 RepID=UPI0024A61EA8|nr:glycosyltransferase family 2 protein [Pelagibius sp. Alg239-R121]
MSPNVTVIVPTFNRAKYLPECLDSLTGQTAKAARIIVVDDGSTDETPSILEGYGAEIDAVRKDNSGKSSALNLALPMVDSEYVWIFDDDDVAHPDALKHHLDGLEGKGRYGFSYSSYQRAGTNADGSIQPGPIRHADHYEGRALFVQLLEENLLPQPSILVRTGCYREMGPFDERLVRSQDYEMLLRLSRRYPAAVVEEVTYYYREHAGTRGSSSDSFGIKALDDKWVKYDRIIFQELYHDLALWEYLPQLTAERSLSGAERRHALIRRFSIMMRYCLWDLALSDLSELLESESGNSGLIAEEQEILRRIFENRAALMFRSGYDGRRLRTGFSKGDQTLAGGIRTEMSRTLYYEFHRDFNAGNYRKALLMLTRLIPLLGTRGVFGAMGSKF